MCRAIREMRASLVAQIGKESACKVGDLGSIPGLGGSFGEGNSYPLQYSGLENSMDREIWQATVCGVAKSWTWLSNFHIREVKEVTKQTRGGKHFQKEQ